VFTPEQFRTKSAEYSRLVKTANSPSEAREFQELEWSFAALADNAQWLRDNHDKTVHPRQHLATSYNDTPCATWAGPIKAPIADVQKSEVTRL
jgi:hypothetical protein